VTSELRVLYVHHRPEGGGAPKSLALMIEHLNGRVDPMVLCPAGAAAEQFAHAGARVATAPAAVFTHLWSSSYHGARWALLSREGLVLGAHLSALRRLIRSFRPHLVHLNDAPLLPAALMTARTGVPVVWHLRSCLPGITDRRSRYIRRQIERVARIAIAIDHDVADSYALDPPAVVVNNPVEIPAAVSPDGDPRAKQRLGIDPTLPAVGLLGYVYAVKGWPDLLHAVATLERRGRAVQIAIVGGPIRPASWFATARGHAIARLAALEDAETALADTARRLGISDRVHLLGFRTAVDDVYRALDVVCFPSRGAGLGRPVLEGQAYAKAIVAAGSSQGGGIVENGRTGLLVPSGDVGALADALDRVLADHDLRVRLGSAARAHAEDSYSPGAVATRIAELYDEALDRQSPRSS
jgi:glycosyltransferase involved in cell wall biosynthesis